MKRWLIVALVTVLAVLALTVVLGVWAPSEEEPPAEATPSEEESTTPILTHGTNSWRLKASTFGEQEIEIGSVYDRRVVEAVEGYVFLQAEFENLSEVDLIDVWYVDRTGEEPIMEEVYSMEGIGDLFVTDSQGNIYPAVIFKASTITFVVPCDGHGFTVYFLDCAPIELEY